MRGRSSCIRSTRFIARPPRLPLLPPHTSALDKTSVVCAESRSLRPDRWDWLEVREYLVLRFDGTTVHFPVQDGDVAQARLRAALTQRPDDCVVAVTEDAYIRVGSDLAVDAGVAVES